MKRLFTTLTILMVSIATLHAQDVVDDNTIVIGNNGKNQITIVDEDTIKFKIAGKEFQMSSESITEQMKEKERYATISSLGALELGINTLAFADYSMYTPEEAVMMQFGNIKSTYVACNIFTENFRLNKSGSFSVDMGVGIAWENYVFAGDYSMRYQDGMMYPIALKSSVKKSKLMARYLHLPMLLNYSYKNKFFIAAGANLDVSIGTRLKHKDPKIVYKSETVTLNPIQLGGTLRIGTNTFYGFINYSFMEMFKTNKGPGGQRLSAGLGLNF